MPPPFYAVTFDLAGVLAELRPGQAVPVVVLDPRGRRRTVTVRLGELPS